MNLIPRTAGELIFDGDVVGELGGISLRELRRNMQMVFQDSYSSLNPRLRSWTPLRMGRAPTA